MNARHTIEDLSEALRVALDGHRCVTAWLGYGNVLFLGFGPDVLSERASDGSRTIPPYEIQSSLADWNIGGAGGGDDDRQTARSTIETLIGTAISGWSLSSDGSLRIDFSNGLTLELAPSYDAESSLDQWWLSEPATTYIGIGGNGQVVAGDTR
jgi:hypothetical protein